ncbi:MAG TPA: endolytic transglycosylase MltG [Gammaproteobacteria bacterium]|nr:endolytic transglycosylase MltG [Gammaproteobacteria bacterium]HAD36148.1 endolytic transglycosylase MltG [Gammaproteobacteria bacterium]HBK77332.1 endolytic transglycosylase MltG [Gammaproteobacteria bacterium]HIA41369.1 endolytic transglycosylase MltG [Gammaproteobacteria bacterium]HIB80762.1 endolytic transglycosylase MltG [Gammaproteobacteria bacterium]
MSKHVLISIAGVVFILVIAMTYLQQAANEPRVLRSNVLLLETGSSLRDFAEMMTQLSDLEWPLPIMVWVMATGRSTSLKAGEYAISTGDSVEEIITQVVAGKVIEHSITFPEGFTLSDMIGRLDSVTSLYREERDLTSELIKQAIDTDHKVLEGLFFPDTYRYVRSDTPVSILQRANKNLTVKLQEAWSGKANGFLLKSTYELLILASIIEKEAVVAHEKPRISGVFINRLRENMRLQTDPTVIYGLGDEFTGALTREHLAKDTPYNTYTRNGLPPTPISCPGWASLFAAAHPEEHNFFYFVAKGDGTHQFSKTFEEHQQAVKTYRRRNESKSQ